MASVHTPSIVLSISRLAGFAVVAGTVIVGNAQFGIQSPKTQAPPSHQTSAHTVVLSIPAPVAPLQTTNSPTTSTTTTATTQPVAANVTHSAVSTPVVTPAPSASVSGLTPVNPTSTGTTTPAQPTSTATTSYTSTNWSGYLATTGTYTAISGSWSVPKAATVSGRTAADATWIGVGGVTASDLIQVGTEDTVYANGHEVSAAFYELLPQSSRVIPSLIVTPGDTMTASLSEVSNGQWTLTITDTATGKSYTTIVAYTSSHSSAEWIEEDPSTTSGTLMPLDGFGSVSFTDSATTNNGKHLTIATSNAQPVTLVSTTKQVIATPSVLGSDGQSFMVTQNP